MYMVQDFIGMAHAQFSWVVTLVGTVLKMGPIRHECKASLAKVRRVPSPVIILKASDPQSYTKPLLKFLKFY